MAGTQEKDQVFHSITYLSYKLVEMLGMTVS